MQKVNQRIVLTKRLLKEGLFRLLKKKAINKITVKELCEESGINRATFYKHYGSPSDVLIDIGTDISQDLKKVSGNPKSMQEIEKSIENICIYLQEKAPLIKTLIQYNTDVNLANNFNDSNKNLWNFNSNLKEYKNLDDDSIRLILTFYGFGIYNIIKLWLTENIKKTPKEIAKLITHIIIYRN